MNRYPVLETRLQWAEAAKNEAGKPFDVYQVSFEPIATILALTAEAALAKAKHQGFLAPVIGQGEPASLQ